MSEPSLATADLSKSKILPTDLTSLDLLKSLAVIIMVIDHMGAYFFPDLWFRAVGRIGFPVWFFLAGYSSGRGVPEKLLIGAVILVAADVVLGFGVLPVNALFTIMAIRLLIDPIMKPVVEKKLSIWVVAAVLVAAIYPSTQLAEYGSMGIITAIFGYLVRHREKVADEKMITHYMYFSLITFVVLQQILFGFSWLQIAVVTLGTLAIRLCLLNLKVVTFPRLSAKLPGFAEWSLKFMGRRTLEIYVAHLLVFKFVAIYLAIQSHH